MHYLISLICGLSGIDIILAMRSMFDSDGLEFSLHDCPYTTEVGEDGTRVLHHEGTPAFSLRMTGDYVTIQLLQLVADLPKDVATMLRAIGCNHRTWTIAYEEVWERITSLDTVFLISRRLDQLTEDERASSVRSLLELCEQWSALRMTDFSGRARTSERKLIEEIEAKAKSGKLCPLGVSKVKLHEEVRGAVIGIETPNATWPLDIAVGTLKWRHGVLKDPAPKAGKKSRSLLPIPSQLDPEVLDVLAGAVITKRGVSIPQQIDPKVFRKVGNLLKDLGCEWNKTQQAFRFKPEQGVPEAISALLDSGTHCWDKDFEYFATPQELVNRMITLAELDLGMKVLEPQAGDGRIALAAQARIGQRKVTCYELMPKNCRRLRELGFEVPRETDFLTVKPEPVFDRVLMNPPFSGGRDMAHITHALGFLKPTGRLVAISSTSWQDGKTAKEAEFRALVESLKQGVEQIPRGAFRESGTDVPTVLLTLKAPAKSQAALPEPSAKSNMEQVALF